MKLSRREAVVLLGSAVALPFYSRGQLLNESTFESGSTSSNPNAIRMAAEALIRRVVPGAASSIGVEVILRNNGQDVFEIESVGGKIMLRGNNGVSIASALNHYLKYFCHRQMTWSQDIGPLEAELPHPSKLIRVVSPFQYRSYLNYCTFSYTCAWWDWPRWQREIDWMALHGINMPLAITGQEAVWQAMLRQFGMSNDEILQFLCGPAFFAWQWMANLEGWGGPLPQTWIDSHVILAKQILQRERELGMTPILQGFTGFVPRVLKAKYPAAHIQIKPQWCKVFEGTAQLDPLDPLFRKMGTRFLVEQQRLFGTDHLYAADPFHESDPPNHSPEYLPAVAKEVLNTMLVVDPQAKIVKQNWSLRKELIVNIPTENIVMLGLTGEGWQGTDGFWGRPWVAGVLHNYGGRVFMAGSLRKALTNALTLKDEPRAGHVVGTGIFPEAIEQNPVFYDAASEIAWRNEVPDCERWLHDEITARYEEDVPEAQDAWKILLQSLYSDGAEAGSLESPICSRPALFLDRAAPNANFKRHYNPDLVWKAWETLQSASPTLGHYDAYRYDLVDVARQALVDLSLPLHGGITSAYQKNDSLLLADASGLFLDLAKDLDTLLATRRDALLGCWLEDAKKWGTNEAERRQYERNARLQVTVWGPSAPEALLFDYSNRQWSGLISGYYIVRWQKFLHYLATQPSSPERRFSGEGLKSSYKRPADDANVFYKELSEWEHAWCDQTERYPNIPTGDSVLIASRLLAKWKPRYLSAYPGYPFKGSVEPLSKAY